MAAPDFYPAGLPSLRHLPDNDISAVLRSAKAIARMILSNSSRCVSRLCYEFLPVGRQEALGSLGHRPNARIVAFEALRKWHRLQHHKPASGSPVSHEFT